MKLVINGEVELLMKYDMHGRGNTNVPRILRDFLNYMIVIQGKSKGTVESYKLDLIMFLRFLKLYKYLDSTDIEFEAIDISDVGETEFTAITLQDLYAFIRFVEEYRKNSTLTRARKVAVLKSFFKYLHTKAKIISENPAAELETPKSSKRLPVYLTLDESLKLLDAVEGRNKERDYCILTLFLNCGLRLSELCSIKISKIKKDTLSIIGKNDKERTIYLNETCIAAMDEYMKQREKVKDLIVDKDYLFISERKTRINKRTVQRVVEKFITGAGLDPRKYTTHKLRHTAATLLYKHANVDIRSLQKILGHENISTTTIYTHVDDEKLREVIKSSPLNLKNNK